MVGVVIAFLVEEVKRYDTKPVDFFLFAVVIVKNAIESTAHIRIEVFVPCIVPWSAGSNDFTSNGVIYDIQAVLVHRFTCALEG